MDPFAPAWLRIPAPPVPASSSSHEQDQHPSSSSSFSFRSAYSGIAPVNGSPVRSYERSSPDQQQQPPASSRMQPHAVPIRTSSLEDDHSPLVDQHAAAGQWKHGHYHQQQQYTGSGTTTGDRMRGKAASVSESSRQRFSHNNNNMTPVAVTNKTTTTGTGTSGCSAAAAAVPDFRELASFQFHTRSGSFGSEAVNGSSGSSGSGASSTDPCSSEDDISILTAAAAASSHSVRFPATAAASGRMTAANNTVTTAAAPATSTFNREFPSLAPAAEIGSSKVSSSVWDSSAKLKVMGGGMKKLWVKSNVNGKDAPLAAGQQQSATNNKLTSSFFTGKKAAVATPAMEILVKHPKTKITSSRSDFFKSLRSSSSSTGTSTAASHSNPISPPAVAADGVKQGDCGSPSLSDEVFRRDSKDEGKVGSKDDASGKVFHEQDSQEQEQEQEQELDMGWIGRSADSILSSSLEAEQRLLKEMGWKEEEDDFYEPLTEDEVREFRDLIVARKSQASESCGSTITDIMTCSKNIKNAYGSMGKNVINFSSWSGAGKKCINSSLASPPEFQQHAAPSSSSSDDSSDDEDENAAAPVPRFHHTCS